jgi:hypothetical protein
MNKNTVLRKNLVFVVILVLFIGMSITLPSLGKNTSKKLTTTALEILVTSLDADTIELALTIPAFEFNCITTTNGEFTVLTLPDEGFTLNSGEAQLPVMRRFLEIPAGATPEMTVTSASWETLVLEEQGLPRRIIPVQPSVLKIPGALEKAEFTLNENYYATATAVPTEIVRVADEGEIRGHHIILVEVYPVQYNPSSGEIRLMNSCTIRINLPGSDIGLTYEKIRRYSSPVFNEMLSGLLLNYGDYEYGTLGSPTTKEGYLIIVYDNFYDEILPLKEWKITKGYDVTVTKTSDIPGGPTQNNIKTYIENAYTHWKIPPVYVLLVGDTAQIPTFTGQETGTATDLYYVTITSPDYFPDIFISRFPAALESQVNVMVNKTVFYEQGNFPSTAFIKKAAFMASEDHYWVTEATHNYVINTYLVPHNYTCDKLYCHTFSATTQQVINALNDGRSLAIYSGHGDTTYWADGPYFSQSNVNSLTNQNKYPFVCSHACLTGQFTVSECFGETWVRAANKGAVAFWGSSDYTYWTEDDILEKKMFSAWWDDHLETIGGMTNKGLYYLYQYYGGGGLSKYYFEAYNVLGDTSVKIWHDEPPVNTPPNTPSDPLPANETVHVDVDTNLSWIGGDPDPEDIITYDVYLGTTTLPPKAVSNQSTTEYNPETMNYNTTYYWKIIAWDNHGHHTGGPLWSFTTQSWIRGDVNGDGNIDVGDVVYLINYLFQNGPAPNPLESGDANSDSVVDVGDVVYLINYLFINGPAPGV